MADPRLPPRAEMAAHVVKELGRYWPTGREAVASLPVAAVESPKVMLPLRLEAVALPDWAASCGVDGSILVPAEACGQSPVWEKVDWWLAAFLLLEGWHERMHEAQLGPIHSYSHRLTGWDERAWDRAWVNRIALFLRRWAARTQNRDMAALFGARPVASIAMTHDVDAVRKTLPIRLKQAAFNLFNSQRELAKGRGRSAARRLAIAAKFLFGRENWWTFDELLQYERDAGIRSRFHFYSDARVKTPRRWLFDPGYDVASKRLRDLIDDLNAGGWQTGLHPSFDAWQSADLIGAQRQRLNSISDGDVVACRQHWLRFSWADTWLAQETAGLREDTTLMFNDRMGFRTAAAFCWTPWNSRAECPHAVHALPTVLMDSHAYDYRPLTSEARRSEFRRWFQEIKDVGGQCAVLWHPHTMTDDYGWKEGFHDCVTVAAEMDLCITH